MGHFPHSKTHQELEQLQQMRAEERGGRQECLKNGGITADTSTYDYFNWEKWWKWWKHDDQALTL